MRALIVDDSSFVREYLKQLLRAMGTVCEEAANGHDALRRLREAEPFDLMLCDLNMPVMGGLECVRSLRQERLQPGMKVMMVTTEAEKTRIIDAIKAGVHIYPVRPFTPDDLAKRVLQTLRGQRVGRGCGKNATCPGRPLRGGPEKIACRDSRQRDGFSGRGDLLSWRSSRD